MTALRWRKNQRSLLAFLAVCLFVILTLQFPGVQKLLRDTLVVYLIKGDDLSQHCGENGEDSSGAIYVLGGSRESLEKKFVTAARLYHPEDRDKNHAFEGTRHHGLQSINEAEPKL
jgi:hypothetical protein